MKLPAIPLSRRPILFAALTLAVLFGVFGFVADEVIEGDTVVFDRAVTMVLRDNGDMMNPIGPAWLEEAGRDVTSLGSFSVLGLIVILVLIGLVLIKRPLAAAYVTFAVLSGTILSSVFKHIYDRPRPGMLEAMRVFTSSFPSGHATVSAVVYLTLAALLSTALRQPAAGEALHRSGHFPHAAGWRVARLSRRALSHRCDCWLVARRGLGAAVLGGREFFGIEPALRAALLPQVIRSRMFGDRALQGAAARFLP